MAQPIVMPKLGNTVESSIIVSWHKRTGDPIAEGDTLCEVETDKATLEVPSTASGTILAQFFNEGDEVPVLVNIAVVGEPGDDYEVFRPDIARATPVQSALSKPAHASDGDGAARPAPDSATASPAALPPKGEVFISPRARSLAGRKGLEYAGIAGTGPGGRIIERDIQAALQRQQRLTPVAQRMVETGAFSAPEHGTGIGGRVMARDLQPAASEPALPAVAAPAVEGEVETIQIRGIRRVIADRMLASLQTTAQLTLNVSADARALLAFRKRLKASPEALGLQQVTINDLVLLATSRALAQHPDVNALFDGDTIAQYHNVHLAFAVDTPRGLLVLVIRNAHLLPLKALAAEAKRLAATCLEGKVAPDELEGGTFTVTNLGSLGIESFTPVLNPPQVGILGVGNINPKPIMDGEDIAFIPHLGLSLTINHQVVDGAPAARFLQTLARYIADIDLLLAL